MTSPPSTDGIWSGLKDDLRRFIRRRVGNDHLADDLLQETFLRIHRGLAGLEETDRLAAWVHRIARNVIYDHYRKAEDPADVGIADDPIAGEERPAAGCSSDCRWLEELVNQLPEKYRDAVRLAESDGLPQQEVADRLGLSLPGAKSRIQRGRRMLREVLERCCSFEFDRRGNVVDYTPKPNRAMCRNCGDGD
jgi:RNA polymerase sigma-70 factor (ECF subfamily)